MHKQGRRHEVGPTLGPTMEYLDLVYQETSDSKSLTHSRPAECGSRQAIQTRPDLPEWSLLPEVFKSICSKWHWSKIDLIAMRLNNLPRFVSPVPDPLATAVDAMGRSGRIRLATNSHIGQSGGEVARLPMQENNSDCSGVAQHALVLGSSGYVHPNPTEPTQPVDTALQPDPSQKSDKSKSPCMAPIASAIKDQGFSEAVAARIEASQRGSTRSVYEARWSFLQSGTSLI